MSQLSLNHTIQTLVTDPESVQKKGIFKNSEIHSKKRPVSATAPKAGNDDTLSIGIGVDGTKVHKLGTLPSYLKKQTKSSVESELVNKHKKFKIAKRELVERQMNLMKDFEHLRSLKDKFKQFGGRDFKLESLDLIEFTGCEQDNEFGDGKENIRIGEPFGDCANNSSMFEFQREIQRHRVKVQDCLIKVVELNAEACTRIQASVTDALRGRIQEIFFKVEEYVKSVRHEHDASMESFLSKLQQFKNPISSEDHTTRPSIFQEEEIAGLRAAIQSLEVQGKMLQSEIDVKNREIEYLRNKEIAYSKSNEKCGNNEGADEQRLRSEIESQKHTIDDYRNKLNEYSKLQEILEKKICQLEEKVGQKNQQMEENVLNFENVMCEERKKYDELSKVFDEMKDANSKIMKKNGSSFESLSNQLAAANEDIKELQFKLGKRDKQIQNLKQMIQSETNKSKDYDQLLLKNDELQAQNQCKIKELQLLRDSLVARKDTIKNQTSTISDLKKKLMDRSAGGGVDHGKKDKMSTSPLHDEQMAKFLEHERIIKKLENNKIRSNVLRDQLLDRISMLEKENDDMKAQIRKFHEDFTINRFMYDEQRRKKRLTEILVKQYQK